MTQNHLLRVTQMNAVYLDKEIEKSFQLIIQEVVKHLPPGIATPFNEELNFLIKLGILKHSVFDQGATFGQQLMNIQYQEISTFKKYLYILFGCLNYIKSKSEMCYPNHRMHSTIFKFVVLFKIFNFINMLMFLRRGEKPLLVERILGLKQVYKSTTPPRMFENKYLARELLWNGFIEVLVHIIPLLNYYKLRRLIKQYNPLSSRKLKVNVVSKQQNITLDWKCAHCGESPILPHHMGCSHVFCYVCLKGNQMADSEYECPKCEHQTPNVTCQRVIST